MALEEALEFLILLIKNNEQATKRNRYAVLASFGNFTINTGYPALTNPCSSAVIKKIIKRPQTIQWNIIAQETVGEIIFRTSNPRNRLVLELMARGGMRIGEVLNLTPAETQEKSLTTQNPKIGRAEETVYVPREILVRLTSYATPRNIGNNEKIYPISSVVAWSMVKKAGTQK